MTIMQLTYILIGLQVVDAVLTYLAIKNGAVEVNPIVAKIKSLLPGKWTWLLAAKVPAIGAVYYLGTVEAKAALAALAVVYVLTAANNFNVWRNQRSKL